MTWAAVYSVLVFVVITLGLSLRILTRNKSVGVTLAWLFLIMIFPIGGAVLYLIFGEQNLGFIRARRAREMYQFYGKWVLGLRSHPSRLDPARHYAAKPLWDQSYGAIRLPAFQHNTLEILDTPETILTAMHSDIVRARSSILLEFYICQADGRILALLEELIIAVKRGVEVKMLLDSVGSRQFFRTAICRRLQQAGVEVTEALHANPLRMLFQRQDLRLHRKILSIDGEIAYTGSMNLADPETFQREANVGVWIDLMVRVEGPTAEILRGVFLMDWEMETGQKPSASLRYPSLEQREKSGIPIQVVPSGPALAKDNLIHLLLTAIYQARRRIVITTPYFVPDDALVLALKAAALRGLEVAIYLPFRNNSFLAKHAGRSFFEELLHDGVVIRRFTGGLLHTKCVLIDDDIALVGSVNLDMRSIWLNFELTLVVNDLETTQKLYRVVADYHQKSQPVSFQQWSNRPYYRKVIEHLARLMSPLL
ncbi:cardiolipin synthase [Gynuella sunshinyii]|uniref:Cardiolipin synthase n=1 Tax=Gynuella sunshinyii YC6258 TaxID=1445510 RepID=A0A0C5V7F0_9GAMM|nr:cardiolipin synthase [Gynuella sunshinyii]AJQ95340.1 phosphatidylserine/phosphatidylglycerophosphate/cardiolipin synthase-related enzyme [Gynuella sunshinyii YC6258]